MLKSNKENGTGVDALLGPNTSFNGTLVFDGLVRIDGIFEGKIKTNDTLVIAETGKVNAEVEAGVVKILGQFEGTIVAKTKIEMYKPAQIKGALHTPNIRMEEGVIFNGSTDMGPIKAATKEEKK